MSDKSAFDKLISPEILSYYDSKLKEFINNLYLKKTDLPESIPFEGGNADYATNADQLDGLHASAFLQNAAPVKLEGTSINDAITAGTYGVYNGTLDFPTEYGTWGFLEVRRFENLCYQTIWFDTGVIINRGKNVTTDIWTDWQRVNDNGNADTLDGLHANELSQNKVLTTDEQINDANLESGIYSVEGKKVTLSNSPVINSSYMMLIVNKHRASSGYGTQIAIPYDTGIQRGIYYRTCCGYTWTSWIRIDEGRDAHTVDGKHSNEFVNYLGNVTDIDNILNNQKYSISPYECTVNGVVANAIGLPTNWWHLKYFIHDNHDGYGFQLAFPLNNGSVPPKYRTSNASAWGVWKDIMNSDNTSNPNILINPDFKINQRGKTEYSNSNSNIYCWDRWCLYTGWKTSKTEDGYASFSCYTPQINSWIACQYVENYADYRGKYVTFSVRCVTGSANFQLLISDGVNQTVKPLQTGVCTVSQYISDNSTRLTCVICSNAKESVNETIVIISTKLEVGISMTQYTPPDPASELLKCQRYFLKRKYTKIFPSSFDGVWSAIENGEFAVPMRVVPSSKLYSLLGTENTLSNWADTTDTDVKAQINSNSIRIDGFDGIYSPNTSLPSTLGGYAFFAEFDAEIY